MSPNSRAFGRRLKTFGSGLLYADASACRSLENPPNVSHDGPAATSRGTSATMSCVELSSSSQLFTSTASAFMVILGSSSRDKNLSRSKLVVQWAKVYS